MVPTGKHLDIYEVAEIIARIDAKPLPLALSSLQTHCRRRRKAIKEARITLPQRLYLNDSAVPDLYIIEMADSGTRHIFQRMKRQ